MIKQTPPSANPTGKLIGGILLLAITVILGIAASNLINDSNHYTSTGSDPDPNATVTCNGVPMSTDQECQHIEKPSGATFTYTYAEQQSYQAQQRIYDAEHQSKGGQQNIGLLLVIVALFCGGAGVSLIAQYRKGRQGWQAPRPPGRF
jgi:hypothetical protein